jgi:hypothetical protein
MKSIILALMLGVVQSWATPDFNKLADAIYKAEGGNKTRHPYGVLIKYRNTTPRQACINTCKHAWRDYSGSEDKFITFLARRYAPVGAANDPTGLNRNWEKNVRKFLQSSE